MTQIYNPIAYIKSLKAVGFTDEQAEVQADEMGKLTAVINDSLVTKEHHDLSIKALEASLKRDMKELETSLKRDMKELETSLRHDMKELETSLRHDMKELETSLKHDMKELETSMKHDMKEMELRLRYDLTIRMGGMITAAVGVIVVAVKLL